MKFKRTLSLLMMGVMLSSSVPFNVFAEDVITNCNNSLEDVTASGSSISITSSDIDVDFNVTGQWNGGFNGEITVTNTSKSKIENWQIEMTFPQEITNIWNARIDSVDNGVYNIKNAGGNNNVDIPVGGSVTFGFTGTYTDDIVAPTNVKLITGRQNASDEEYSIDYQLMSDWGSGFTAQIVITNHTDKPMEAWHLEFDYAGEISSIWNGIIEKNEGSRYYISNAGYNSVIGAKEIVVIGISGLPDSEHDEPSDYLLSYFNSTDNTNSSENNIIDMDYEADSDNDGVADYIEKLFGSDINIKDTDGDGLSDCDEIYITGTSPIQYDTDDNGISDADEDIDNDSLTNIIEIQLGTLSYFEDTDYDNLTDYEELYKYNTDPLLSDTDNDGLSDDDEFKLGFNPNMPDTDNNGIIDSEEKLFQTHTAAIDCPESPAVKQVKIEMTTCGNLSRNITIIPTYNKNMYSTNLVGLVGSPIDISVNSPFDSAIVTFVYDPQLVENEDNLGILWYDKQNGFYEDMHAIVDKDKHTVTFETTHFSEYSLADVNKWFSELQEKIDYDQIPRPKNNSWDGEVVTAQKLVEDYKENFGLDMGLYNVLPYCEDGDVFCEMGKFYMTLNGEEIEYDCLFMSHNEFTDAHYFAAGEEACICPSYGVVAYNTRYDTNTFNLSAEILNKPTVKLPPYSEVTNPHYKFIKRYFIPNGQIDDTDTDGDGLYDVYEIIGMRLSNGQIITTNPNNPDEDEDGLTDGSEMGLYNVSKLCFPRYSDPKSPNNVDGDGFITLINYYGDDGFLSKYVTKQHYFKTNSIGTTVGREFERDIELLTGYRPLICISELNKNDALLYGLADENNSLLSIDTLRNNSEKYMMSIELLYHLINSEALVRVKYEPKDETDKSKGNLHENNNLNPGTATVYYNPEHSLKTFIQKYKTPLEMHDEMIIDDEINNNIYKTYEGLPVGEFKIIGDSLRYVGLAHEFIHAMHDIDGVKNNDNDVDQIDAKFFVEYGYKDDYGNDNNFEYACFIDVTNDEEIKTIGMNDYVFSTNVNDLTENDIRMEHTLPHRLTHNNTGVKLYEKDNSGNGYNIGKTYNNWVLNI